MQVCLQVFTLIKQGYDLNTLIRDENPDVTTLPQYFKNNGYYSVGLGKIFDNRSVDSNYDGVSWSTQFLQGMLQLLS